VRLGAFLISVFLAVMAFSTVTSNAQSRGKDAASGKVDEPGTVDEVQELQEVAAVDASSSPSVPTLLGRMHPALVHFPIGWVFLLLIVEALEVWSGREDLSRAGLLILALACLSFVPAAITGFLRAASMPDDSESRALLLLHRNINIAAGIVCLGALALRLGRLSNGSRTVRWTYLSFVAASAVLLLIAGHLGGKMVFGSDYLPF